MRRTGLEKFTEETQMYNKSVTAWDATFLEGIYA